MFPKIFVELRNFFVNGKREAAEALQLKSTTAEWAFAKGGINGNRWVVARYLSYPGLSSAHRCPYQVYGSEAKQSWHDARMSSLASIGRRLSEIV